MRQLLTDWWATIRVYFGFRKDPACLGDECGTGSLWTPR